MPPWAAVAGVIGNKRGERMGVDAGDGELDGRLHVRIVVGGPIYRRRRRRCWMGERSSV